MKPVADYLAGTLVVLAVPLAVISVGLVGVAFIALTARRASTRRHCLDVLRLLTRFAGVLRGQR
jgi:hypothetical protein